MVCSCKPPSFGSRADKSMHDSRAVLVLGMHRSGTSAFSRSMQALGVYLGNNFLEDRPDNATGYWEDKGICQLNEGALLMCGVRWEDARLIEDSKWSLLELEALRTEAADYIRSNFRGHPLWGFKDPRSLRLLPFWQPILRSLGVDPSYVIAIPNPRSVSISLFEPQGMDQVAGRMLWLVYTVPYLPLLKGKTFVVTDYDLFMADPRDQLDRSRGF
jgi:O-antigen biosynthesis protein